MANGNGSIPLEQDMAQTVKAESFARDPNREARLLVQAFHDIGERAAQELEQTKAVYQAEFNDKIARFDRLITTIRESTKSAGEEMVAHITEMQGYLDVKEAVREPRDDGKPVPKFLTRQREQS